MEKKKRDYVFLLVFIILSFICLGPLNKLNPAGGLTNKLITGTTIVVWYIFCYRVTSNFYPDKRIRVSYALLLVFQLFFMSYVHLKDQTDISALATQASIGYLANLLGLSLIFYILLRDVFTQKHDLTYSLLGATNIYFMIPVLFSYLYSLLAVHNPNLVHADPFSIQTVLMNCFDYSMFVFTGIDYPGEKIGDELQSIGILEAISANLFIVFVIGRLMSK